MAMRTRALPLAAALLLHLAVLLPIGLTASRLGRPPPGAGLVIVPLDLAPTAFTTGRAGRREAPPGPASTAPAPAPAADRSAADPSAPPARPRPRVAAAVAAAVDAAGSEARPPHPTGAAAPPGLIAPRLPCPAAPGDRLGQRVCAVGPGIGREDPGEPPSAPASSQRAAADRRAREAGFERQVEANRAWRDYTRGDGPYPGLRSLFSER